MHHQTLQAGRSDKPPVRVKGMASFCGFLLAWNCQEDEGVNQTRRSVTGTRAQINPLRAMLHRQRYVEFHTLLRTDACKHIKLPGITLGGHHMPTTRTHLYVCSHYYGGP